MTATATTPAPRKSLEPFLKDDVEYYDHQIDGIRRLAKMPSFILADDMGLGKSLQALTVFAIDVKMGLSETCLVVCPVTLRDNWADEIEKFTRLPYTLLGEEPHPTKRNETRKLSTKRRQEQLEEWMHKKVGPRILIANYEQIASETLAPLFARFKLDVIIYDEAHYLKNPKAKRTKAGLGLISKRSFMLTGTPMLNQVDELWALLHRVNPVMYPKYWGFVNRYCVFGGYEGRQIVGTKNEKELRTALGGVMIRRLKKDTLKRDEPNIIPVVVGLSDTQRRLYDSVAEDLLLSHPTGIELDVANALTQFLRLKQICGTPFAIDDAFPDDSMKLDRMVELVIEIAQSNEKVVLFTQFRGVLEAVHRRMLKAGFDNRFQLHGDIPAKERVGIVKAWAGTTGAVPLMCMIQVAGIGLNMTASSNVIRIDKLFVPGLNKQAVDRVDRIGQVSVDPVRVFDLIAKGTVEHRVEQILRQKEKTFGDIVEGSIGMRRLLEALKEQLANDMS